MKKSPDFCKVYLCPKDGTAHCNEKECPEYIWIIKEGKK
jgi:hypothetical protein